MNADVFPAVRTLPDLSSPSLPSSAGISRRRIAEAEVEETEAVARERSEAWHKKTGGGAMDEGAGWRCGRLPDSESGVGVGPSRTQCTFRLSACVCVS